MGLDQAVSSHYAGLALGGYRLSWEKDTETATSGRRWFDSKLVVLLLTGLLKDAGTLADGWLSGTVF